MTSRATNYDVMDHQIWRHGPPTMTSWTTNYEGITVTLSCLRLLQWSLILTMSWLQLSLDNYRYWLNLSLFATDLNTIESWLQLLLIENESWLQLVWFQLTWLPLSLLHLSLLQLRLLQLSLLLLSLLQLSFKFDCNWLDCNWVCCLSTVSS